MPSSVFLDRTELGRLFEQECMVKILPLLIPPSFSLCAVLHFLMMYEDIERETYKKDIIFFP